MLVETVLFCGLIVLCALVLWLEHKERVELTAEIERRRVSTWLRQQAIQSEKVSKCKALGSQGQDREAYASAVLEETAWEIDSCFHHPDVAETV